jgi:hypothetical protein
MRSRMAADAPVARAGVGRLLRSAVVLAVLGMLAGVGSIASAAGTQSGGAVKMFGVPKGAGGAFMFTGAIGDFGQTQRENANGAPNANGDYVKFTLKHGTFVANATGFFNALNHAKFSFNKATCSGSVGAAGPATLSDGTGSYAGISGTLRVVGTFAQIGPRLKNGKCNMSNNAKPVSQFNVVTAAGHVSFG